MGIDINTYRASLAHRLASLSVSRQSIFAAWCSESLFLEFGAYLRKQGGPQMHDYLRSALDLVWRNVLVGELVAREDIDAALHVCQNVSWEDDAVAEGDEFMNNGAVELVECLMRTFQCWLGGGAASASEAAERVLNRIDYEITMVIGDDNSWSQPKTAAEMDMEDSMLSFLSREVGPFDASVRQKYRV